MGLGNWLAVAGIVTTLLIVLVPFLWRSLYWRDEKELHRIYRKAARLRESGIIASLRRISRGAFKRRTPSDLLEHSLLSVIDDKDFWRSYVLRENISYAEEKAQFRLRLSTRAGDQQQLNDALDSFYDAAFDGLAAAHNHRWVKRADRWWDQIAREKRTQIDSNVETFSRSQEIDPQGESVLRPGADLKQLEAKQDDMLAQLGWAYSHDPERALRIAHQFSIYWDARGRRNDAREVLRIALNLVLERNQDVPAELQIAVLDRAAHLAIKQADCVEAERYARKMLSLSRDDGHDSKMMATTLQRFGKAEFYKCDDGLARQMLEESLIQFQNLKAYKEVAWTQFDLGLLEVNRQDFGAARSWFKKSLDLQREYGDKNSEGTVLVNLAFAIHKQGDWESARAHMADAEKLLQGENYLRWCLHFLGRLDVVEGNFGEARDHFTRSLEIFSKPERFDKLGIVRSLLGFSYLAAKEKNWERAVRLLGVEDGRRKEMGLPEPPLDWKVEIEFILAGAREAIGQDTINSTWDRGKAMTWKQAIESCLN